MAHRWYEPSGDSVVFGLRCKSFINQLLSTLDMANDYVCILEYANIALGAIPGSTDAYYWLIYAMNHLGMGEIANNELKAAKHALTENDYDDLLKKLEIQER